MKYHRFYILLSLTAVLTSVMPISASADTDLQLYGAVHQTWLTPSPSNPGAEFSNAIAMDGDTLVVGARHDSVTVGVDPVYYAGAVYVYTRDGSIWNLQARLSASDAEAYDLFGSSVDIDNDTIIVGAVGSDGIDEEGEAAPEMGAAYVFTRSGDQWEQQAKIEPEDGYEDDNYGNAVAIVDERIIVGASAKDLNKKVDAGKVYSYYRSGTKWYPAQSVTSNTINQGDFFGSALDYDGQRLVVGAQAEGAGGAAYVFYRTGGTWTQEAKLEPDDDQRGDNFGASVAIDSETVVVGAPLSDPNQGQGEIVNAGAAYVYHKKANTWLEQAKLVSDDATVFDHFGQSVTIDDTTVVVGASTQDYYTIAKAGSAYVYERTSGEWDVQTKIISGAPYNDGDFGASLAIDDEMIVVGEPGTSTLFEVGSVHVYSLEPGVLPATGFAPGFEVNNTSHIEGQLSTMDTLQIEIPEIGIQTDIVGIAQEGNSWNVDWLTTAVGHLAGTAYPTHVGNTVIAGHINLPDGSDGPFVAVDQLQWGDEIIIHLDGSEFTYEVRNIYSTNPHDLNVLKKSDGYDWITLITCANFNAQDAIYTQRVIVEAVRVR